MLWMAMFVLSYRWIQLQLFIALNFLSLLSAFVVLPFQETHMNLLNVLNEFFGLLISYVLLSLQD